MKIRSLLMQNVNIIKYSGQKLFYQKILPAKDIFIRQNVPVFKYLSHKKSTNLDEATIFAKENFGVKNFNINDLSCANLLNQIFTKIYNMTKGNAVFPAVVSIKKQKNTRFLGESGSKYIEVIQSPDMVNTIIHETGHYNHERGCSNFYKMGKLQELIDDGITDFSIYEQFKNDKNSLKLIKKHICPYATSSAAEFVACTFNAIINGKKLPAEIYDLYKKYEGPFADLFIVNAKRML